MAVEYVVTTNADRGHRVSGFAHSTVPLGDNAAGTPWSQALVEPLGDTTSQVPASILPPGRQALLDAGSVFEWGFTVSIDANGLPAEKTATVEAWLVATEDAELTVLQNRLQFWGHTGSAG